MVELKAKYGKKAKAVLKAESLKDPAKASLALGSLSLGMALPLWILIPLILVAVGISLYVIVSFLPFIIAGLIFGFTYWVLKRVGMREPFVWILPFAFGLLALVPAFVPGLRAAVMGTVNTGAQAMGILGDITSWIIGPFLWVAAIFVLGFLLIFLNSVRTLGKPGAFISATIGLMLGTAIALNAVGLSAGPLVLAATITGEEIVIGALPIILGGTIAGLTQVAFMRLERR